MKKEKLSTQILLCIISLLMCSFIYACTVREYGFSLFGVSLYVFALASSVLYFLKKKIFNSIIDFLIKYRYIIAALCFAVCLTFKIHGSSIGMFNKVIPVKKDESIKENIFGVEKPIRSDEWQIMTPYNLSQKYNDFKVNSQIVSLDGQNMIIGFNSAVRDITVLGKPLVWGYILLGNEYGLSWYWCLKTIMILLFAYETLNIITKNKRLSLFGALLITFGPSTQWWFAPHMPDVILWFMVLFTTMYYLVSSEKTWLKNLLVIIMPFIAMEYVIALFPSFQVGLGYFMIAIFLAIMYRENNKFFAKKENIIRIIIIGILSCALVGYFLKNNMNELKLLNNTVYPGSRNVLGGNNNVKDLFTDLGTPFLGYTDDILYGNQCEDSTYIHFGVFFLMLMPILYKSLKKKEDKDCVLGLTMSIVMIVYASFMIFGFPEILSKITFFKYINRMNIIYGYISVIFTIWGLNALEKTRDDLDNNYIKLAIISYILFNLSFISPSLKAFMPKYFYYIEILLYLAILYSFYKFELKKLGFVLTLGILTFSSISINPVVSGISAINNHPSTDVIKDIVAKDKEAYWLGYNNFGYSSYLITLGARTANAMNFYPDLSKWETIDPDKKYEENWNRYAYIITNFTDGDNFADNLMTPDVVNVFINTDTVYRLGVKYILASVNDDLTIFNTSVYNYEVIYEDAGVKIYELHKHDVSSKKGDVKNGKETRKK